MNEFWAGFAWGVGALVMVSALIVCLLAWRAPRRDEADEHGVHVGEHAPTRIYDNVVQMRPQP